MTRPILDRDVDPTGFTEALESLLQSVPDGLCATFLDAEGETIDLATRIDSYEARVYSAELALPLASLRTALKQLDAGSPKEVCVVGEARSAVLCRVADGCELLLVVEGFAALPRGARECARAARTLFAEAAVPSHPPVSVAPESAAGERPRAFLDNGRTRRIAAVVGQNEATLTESVLVQTPEGDECVIVRDPTTQRWFRV